MNRIGVFGGSFDPPHIGHVYLARQAISECMLDQVIVVPVGGQPFKREQQAAAGEHRYNMANLAFEHDSNVLVSDIEIKKGGISYTADTLREIKQLYGEDADVSFILGADAFLKLEKWKNFEELVDCYSFIAGTRPGYRNEELQQFIARLVESRNAKVTTVCNRQVPVSSTEIREMLRTGKGFCRFVPAEVERYIRANGLY
ncbi:MAG: nicotinate-nucleotide adenylyltransferase [Clostridiales bacterium]|nr:nicotinate-nucleotide adenylyltransferase [Clostridiales bacterium]